MEKDADVIARALVFREFSYLDHDAERTISLDDTTVVETGPAGEQRTPHATEPEAEAAFVAAIRAVLSRRSIAVAPPPTPAPPAAAEPTAPVIAAAIAATPSIVIEDEKRLAKQAKIEAFLQSEAGRDARSLAICLEGTTKYAETVRALAAVGLPDSLRTLTLCTYRAIEQFFLTDGDPRAIFPALGRVERLELQAASLVLDDVSLPGIRELSVRAAALSDAAPRALTHAEWPALERIDLWLGSPFYGGDASFEALAPLFSGERFPRLRHLGLMNTVHSDEIAAALPRAPILERLETVDLSYGLLRARGARALLDGRAALAHLRRLRVTENDLDDAESDALTALGAHVDVGSQRPEERWVRATGIEHYVPTLEGEAHVYLDMIDDPVDDEPELELEL